MKKKKKWIGKILKITGISAASVIGFIGLSIGVFALFGGLKEKVVPLTGMTFEQTAYVLDGNKIETDPNDFSKNSNYDTSIKIIPQNEDATKLDVTLTGGNNIVTLPSGNDSCVGQNLNIKLATLTGQDTNSNKDAEGNYPTFLYNKGGEFTLTATQEEALLTTKTKVFL